MTREPCDSAFERVAVTVLDPDGFAVNAAGPRAEMGRFLGALASERRERVIESVQAERSPGRTDGRKAA